MVSIDRNADARPLIISIHEFQLSHIPFDPHDDGMVGWMLWKIIDLRIGCSKRCFMRAFDRRIFSINDTPEFLQAVNWLIETMEATPNRRRLLLLRPRDIVMMGHPTFEWIKSQDGVVILPHPKASKVVNNSELQEMITEEVCAAYESIPRKQISVQIPSSLA